MANPERPTWWSRLRATVAPGDSRKKLRTAVIAGSTAILMAFLGAFGEQIFGWMREGVTDTGPTVHVQPLPNGQSQPSSDPARTASSSPSPPATPGAADEEDAPATARKASMAENTFYYWALPGAITAKQRAQLDEHTTRAFRDDLLETREIAAVIGEWFYAKGGADAGTTRARVYVTAEKKPVTVVGIFAAVQERGEKLRGSFFQWPSQGQEIPTKISLDLDETRPTADYFDDKTYKIPAGDSASFDVTAATSRTLVKWKLGIRVVDAQGKASTIFPETIFRTTPELEAGSTTDPRGSYEQTYVLDISRHPPAWLMEYPEYEPS